MIIIVMAMRERDSEQQKSQMERIHCLVCLLINAFKEKREQKKWFLPFLFYSYILFMATTYETINRLTFFFSWSKFGSRNAPANKRTNGQTAANKKERFFFFQNCFFQSRFFARLLCAECPLKREQNVKLYALRCRTGLIRFVSFWLFVFQLKCRKTEMA